MAGVVVLKNIWGKATAHLFTSVLIPPPTSLSLQITKTEVNLDTSIVLIFVINSYDYKIFLWSNYDVFF